MSDDEKPRPARKTCICGHNLSKHPRSCWHDRALALVRQTRLDISQYDKVTDQRSTLTVVIEPKEIVGKDGSVLRRKVRP